MVNVFWLDVYCRCVMLFIRFEPLSTVCYRVFFPSHAHAHAGYAMLMSVLCLMVYISSHMRLCFIFCVFIWGFDCTCMLCSSLSARFDSFLTLLLSSRALFVLFSFSCNLSWLSLSFSLRQRAIVMWSQTEWSRLVSWRRHSSSASPSLPDCFLRCWTATECSLIESNELMMISEHSRQICHLSLFHIVCLVLFLKLMFMPACLVCSLGFFFSFIVSLSFQFILFRFVRHTFAIISVFALPFFKWMLVDIFSSTPFSQWQFCTTGSSSSLSVSAVLERNVLERKKSPISATVPNYVARKRIAF